MHKDSSQFELGYSMPEIKHHYGQQVHLMYDPTLAFTLHTLSRPETFQPAVHYLIQSLYHGLVSFALNRYWPKKAQTFKTRMAELHPEATFTDNALDASLGAVCVNLARAGTVPSQVCFDLLNHLFEPAKIRQDHISINRKVDASESVVGTDLGGVKIGGKIDGKIVFFPDPMGATGSTLCSAMDLYLNHVEGRALEYIALHLIVTPEYLRKVTQLYPDLKIFALRLDRGLSPTEILETEPGTHWEQEKGLNDKQYIVPGAGGLGEVINNAYC